MASSSSGRPRDSCVWKHLKDVENDQKTICIVIKDDGTECGQSFNGKFTTNLKGQFKSAVQRSTVYLKRMT